MGERIDISPHLPHNSRKLIARCLSFLNDKIQFYGDCNTWKSDKLVGPHFIKKLIARNENIMGSNHPWKYKIEQLLGKSPALRANALEKHFDQVKAVIEHDYW